MRNELLSIIRAAIIDTAKRPPSSRGGYIFDEAKLQAAARQALKERKG